MTLPFPGSSVFSLFLQAYVGKQIDSHEYIRGWLDRIDLLQASPEEQMKHFWEHCATPQMKEAFGSWKQQQPQQERGDQAEVAPMFALKIGDDIVGEVELEKEDELKSVQPEAIGVGDSVQEQRQRLLEECTKELDKMEDVLAQLNTFLDRAVQDLQEQGQTQSQASVHQVDTWTKIQTELRAMKKTLTKSADYKSKKNAAAIQAEQLLHF